MKTTFHFDPMNTMKRFTFLFCVLAFTACNRGPVDRDLQPPRFSEGNQTRFKVRQVQQVEDSLAYNGTRGVYIITDTETGVEYVGVSGIGISELGSHQAGKNNRRTDER